MEDKLRPNEINLFGQRFHASVAITYLGLGFILGGASSAGSQTALLGYHWSGS